MWISGCILSDFFLSTFLTLSTFFWLSWPEITQAASLGSYPGFVWKESQPYRLVSLPWDPHHSLWYINCPAIPRLLPSECLSLDLRSTSSCSPHRSQSTSQVLYLSFTNGQVLDLFAIGDQFCYPFWSWFVHFSFWASRPNFPRPGLECPYHYSSRQEQHYCHSFYNGFYHDSSHFTPS